jgi:DNA-binding PadR family transcriptional regulator
MFERFDIKFGYEATGARQGRRTRQSREDRNDPRKDYFFEMRQGDSSGRRGERGDDSGRRGERGEGSGRHGEHGDGSRRRGESRGGFDSRGHGDPREPFGGRHGGGQRFFGRGDVKYALLELLVERPMHGYEMMKALEEKSGGFYVPSAGTIYPTLQMLEDRGLVTSSQDSGKRIYQITEAGRAQLAERQTEEVDLEMISRLRGFVSGENNRWNTPEVQAVRTASAHVWHMLMHATRRAVDDPKQLARLQNVIEQWGQDLTEITQPSQAEGEEPPA